MLRSRTRSPQERFRVRVVHSIPTRVFEPGQCHVINHGFGWLKTRTFKKDGRVGEVIGLGNILRVQVRLREP